MAIFNGSKMEEVDETESINMKSTIDLYNERIRDEIRIKTYKLIFEEKRDICYSPITYKLKRIKAIRGILDKKESTSKCKLKDLDKELSEHQKEILEDITNHLVSNSMNIEEISNDGDDERIIKRLKGTFEELHKSAQSLTGLNASALFKLIKKVTIADGRLEMVRQIIEIRKIVNAKHINEDDKKRLEKVIFQFYSPALAYDIDMDVYDSLLKCTENVSNPPKGLKGGPNHVQQPFFILAVAMAKKDKLKLEKSKNENPQNYVYYFPQKPKRSNKEDPNSTIFVKPDSSSISRAKGFVTSWVNSDFTKSLKTQVDDSSSSLYVSVSAYYLTALL